MPFGSIVKRSTIWPRSVGFVRSSRLYKPIERRLVAIEHDLNLFVGAARKPRRPTRDRPCRRRPPPPAPPPMCSSTRPTSTPSRLPPPPPSPPTCAADRREVDAAARAGRQRGDQRARRQTVVAAARIADARGRAELRRRPALGDVGEALAEREQAGRFGALPRRDFGRRRRLDDGRRLRASARPRPVAAPASASGSSGFGCSTTGGGGGSAWRCVEIDEAHDALRQLERGLGLRRRHRDQRHDDAGDERDAAAPSSRFLRKRWSSSPLRDHGMRCGRSLERTDLALDDPLAAPLLFFLLDLEQVAFEQVQNCCPC